MPDFPGPRFSTPSLIGACLAVVSAVPVTAFLGSALGDSYESRVLIYGGLLLWVIVGAVTVFALASRRGGTDRLSARSILLWLVSSWLWPLLLLGQLARRR